LILTSRLVADFNAVGRNLNARLPLSRFTMNNTKTTTLPHSSGGEDPNPFDKLNEQQRAAAEHGLEEHGEHRPLLVIAGAGSGKTMTLAARVARLVLAGVDPQRILMLTFSRRAVYGPDTWVTGVRRHG
jgi:hypothetical protein